MKKLLWFGKSNDNTSFARITDSMLIHLSKHFEITLLSNDDFGSKKFVRIGSNTKTITFENYKRGSPFLNNLEISMNYILIQIADLLNSSEYDYFLICNGIYEVEWFLKKIFTNKKHFSLKTKYVAWAPIDYVPTFKQIEYCIKADIFLTMTPTMVSIIKKIIEKNNIKTNCLVDFLGHGSDIILYRKSSMTMTMTMTKVQVNALKNKVWTSLTIDKFLESDIIILNANSCKAPRKRIDITVDAYKKFLRNGLRNFDNRRIILWLHTELKNLKELNITFDKNENYHYVFSNNTVSNEVLSLIYSMSDISLQTSTGEGWSLTNMEAALYRSLQVVPDFLACKFHFEERGLLIPITLQKDVSNHDNSIVGVVSVDDTVKKLEEAINLIVNDKENLNKILDNAYEYSSSYKWSNISRDLSKILRDPIKH